MSKFPSLLGQRFTVNGIQANVGSKDIVLSSSGWVMITNREEQQKLRFLARSNLCRLSFLIVRPLLCAYRSPFEIFLKR